MGTDNTLRGIPGKDEEQSSEIRAILPHQSVVNSCEGIMNVNNQARIIIKLSFFISVVTKCIWHIFAHIKKIFLQLHFDCSQKVQKSSSRQQTLNFVVIKQARELQTGFPATSTPTTKMKATLY